MRYTPPNEEKLNSIRGKVLLCQTKKVKENPFNKPTAASVERKTDVFNTIQFFLRFGKANLKWFKMEVPISSSSTMIKIVEVLDICHNIIIIIYFGRI